MKYLTASLEDYLEVIYILGKNSSAVGITDIAQSLGVSKPGVNKAINILKNEGLISQEKYGKINITLKGKNFAEAIYRKHQILSKFLTEILQVNPKTAEVDACKIEHILSHETIEKMEKYLTEKA